MSLAWQYGQHISIRMSLPSAGSARGVSWALWLPRPRPPLIPILKAYFQPSASVNCPGVNWKRKALKCGWVSTTLPWSSRSPVRPEVRKSRRKDMKLNSICYINKNECLNLHFIPNRLHQEAVCIRNRQLHFFPWSDFDPGMWNHRFPSSKHISHLAEAQRRRARWQRGWGDRGRRDVGPHTGPRFQTLQGHSHSKEKDNKSREKGDRRRGCL